MLLLSLPARLAKLGDSLWLDEAWVANSLLAPTVRETLYFDRWAQSTPPLFLVLARAVVWLAGYAEPALRIVPLFAALAGLLILAVALRSLFPPPVALLGFAVALSNYWVIKCGQQVKQYGTDFFTACLLVLVLDRVLRNGCRKSECVLLALLGSVSTFLSFTSPFWFAAAVIAVALPDPKPSDAAGSRPGGPHYLRAMGLALLLAACLGVCYFAFVRPNLAPWLFRNWAPYFVDLRHPGASLEALLQAFGLLIAPLNSPLMKYPFWALNALLAFGAFRAARLSLRGDRKALTALLAGPLPLFVAVLASAARIYPILNYSRMLVWAVPSCVLLLCCAIRPGARRLASWSAPSSSRLLRYALPSASIAVVIASQAVFFAFPRPSEKNREAAEFIRSHARGSDLVFVHGGMNEQFLYYRRLLAWHPDHVYFGNTEWPCCALNKTNRTSSPGARDLLDDVARAAVQARTHTLWLLLPGAAPGHWSIGLAPQIDAMPRLLRQQGCRLECRQPFSQTLVLAFSCQ